MKINKATIKKIIIIAAAVVVLFTVVSVTALSCFVTEKFFDKESFVEVIDRSSLSMIHESGEKAHEWFSANEKPIEYQAGSFEGKSIEIKNKTTSHSYVIILRSLMTEPEDFSQQAYHFYNLGFNIYIPEYLPDEVTMGITEKDALKQMIDYVVNNDEDAVIYIYGMGIGATTTLLYLGEDVPQNVKGVIADSAYCRVDEVFKENIKEVYNLPEFPFVAISSLYTDITRGWSYSDVDVISCVEKTQIPVLYIHGTEDSVVPVNQSNDLFEATLSEGTKQITIYGADHCRTLNTDHKKYWREVDEFIVTCYE